MSECTHTPWITLLLILIDASLFYFSILQPFLPNGKNGAGGPNARAHAATSWKWESADAPVNLLLPAMETQLRRLHAHQSPPIQVTFSGGGPKIWSAHSTNMTFSSTKKFPSLVYWNDNKIHSNIFNIYKNHIYYNIRYVYTFIPSFIRSKPNHICDSSLYIFALLF